MLRQICCKWAKRLKCHHSTNYIFFEVKMLCFLNTQGTVSWPIDWGRLKWLSIDTIDHTRPTLLAHWIHFWFFFSPSQHIFIYWMFFTIDQLSSQCVLLRLKITYIYYPISSHILYIKLSILQHAYINTNTYMYIVQGSWFWYSLKNKYSFRHTRYKIYRKDVSLQ